MSLRILKISVHWTPAEAHAVLECLDQLRDCVWERFGDAIIESMREGWGCPEVTTLCRCHCRWGCRKSSRRSEGGCRGPGGAPTPLSGQRQITADLGRR